MVKGVEMVRMALALHAFNRLLPHYDQEMAAKLSAAITNEVFSDIPATVESRQFLVENRPIVRVLAKSIAEDVELCRLLSSAMMVRSVLDWAHGKKDTEHTFDPVDHLRELGLYMDDSTGEGLGHHKKFYYRAANYLGRVSAARNAGGVHM